MATRFDVIEERLQQAYPGPWHREVTDDGIMVVLNEQAGFNWPVCTIGNMEEIDGKDSWSADLIANAPDDLRFLLDEVNRLRAALRQVDGEKGAQ